MSMLYNLSIKNKLIGIILFVTILALGIGFTLVIVSNITSFKEDMKNNTIVTAQVIGEYCVSPLIFEDRAGAEEILATLADVPSITKARVYDAREELFVSFATSEEPVAQSPVVRERSSEFVDNYLHVYQPIIYKNEYYGMIYLQTSTQLLDKKIRDYLRYMALLMVGLTIVAVFLAIRLQRIISKPILNLARVAQQIAEEKDYSIRVQKQGSDETGLLYDGFNNMLDQVQHRELERDSAYDALREGEEKFRTLTSNIPGAVYRCANNPDWTMDFISDVIEDISGYKASDFIQNRIRSYGSIILLDDGKMVEETVHKAISNREPYIIEYRIIRSDGHIKWVYEKGQGIFSDDGNLLWLDGAIFDITERKLVEEELAKHRNHLEDLVETRTIEITKANQHLRETQAQLVQSAKMASLGNLVAGIAHEINTPIGAVNSMQDTLFRSLEKLKNSIEKQYPEEQKKLSKLKANLKVIDESKKVINSGTDRVINIVKRLRSFARLDEAELKTVDIHNCLEDTLTLIHHDIKHNIQVKKAFGDFPPVSCYPGKLNQVFLNILVNAKQAIKEKGIIDITTYTKQKHVFIEIKDNGVGIEKEHLKKVFDPGYTTKGVGVGTGLGLSICYQIMQDHLGEILVESEVNKGTTFTVVLPMDLDDRINQGSVRPKV